MLGAKTPLSGSLSLARLEEALVASGTLMGPGLEGGGLSGLAGETRPWIVLETRAETVTKLRSGDTGVL